MYFKELGGKYKFDYFSDKKKINAFQISLDYKEGGNWKHLHFQG